MTAVKQQDPLVGSDNAGRQHALQRGPDDARGWFQQPFGARDALPTLDRAVVGNASTWPRESSSAASVYRLFARLSAASARDRLSSTSAIANVCRD